MKDYSLILEREGVIKKGHFQLTSGKHSDTYINKDAVFSIPWLFKQIVGEFANEIEKFIYYGIISGPAVAGAILAAPVSLKLDATFVYPEKGRLSDEGKMIFRRGYEKVIPGKKVVLCEDIITTGGSVVKTIDAVRNLGGDVVGVMAIWNRSGWQYEGIPVKSLINKKVDSWYKEDCPLCRADIPLTDPKAA